MGFSKMIKQLMKVLLVVFMSLTVIVPDGILTVRAEENTITTDKDEYEVGEPIYVTASTSYSGAWVSIIEESDGWNATSYYWYYVDGREGISSYYIWKNGETYNIFDTCCSKRGGYSKGWNLPAGNYKVAILKGNYEHVVHKSITIVDGTSEESITAEKTTFAANEPVNIVTNTHHTDGKPYVGIYAGKDTTTGDLLAWYYASFSNGITVNARQFYDFADGDYTAVLYGVDEKYVSFTVAKANDITLTFDKEGNKPVYKYGESVNVTIEDYVNSEAFIGVYPETADYEIDQDFLFLCKLNGNEVTVDVVKEAKDRGIDLTPGNYIVHLYNPDRFNLFTSDGYDGNSWEIVKSKAFTIAVTYDDDPDNIEWTLSEDHTASTITLKQLDDPTKTVTYNAVVGDKVTVEPTCTEKGSDTYPVSFSFPEGEELVTVNDTTEFTYDFVEEIAALDHDWVFDGYESNDNNTTVYGDYTCSRCDDTKQEVVLSVDKASYSVDEPVMTTVNYPSNNSQCVGLYKLDESYNPNSGGEKSIFWAYVSEVTSPFDMLKTRNENGRARDYGGGKYKIVLFKDGNYNPDIYVEFEVKPFSSITTDKDTYKYGESITVTTTSVYGTPWVGLYEYDNSDPLNETLLKYYYPDNAEYTKVIPSDWIDILVPGHYKFILFKFDDYVIDETEDNVLTIKSFFVERVYKAPEVVIAADNSKATFTFVPTDPAGENLVKEVEMIGEITTPATCEADGEKTYTAELDMGEGFVCENGETVFTATATEVVEKTGHDWNEPEWTWDDTDSAVAKFVCKNDEEHVVEVNAEIKSSTDNYTITYIATVTGPDGKEYTDTKTAAELEDDMKFRIRVSSREGDSVGSVTATVFADYHGEVAIKGDLVNENNVKVEMWMQNVGSLGVDSLRYYGTEFAPSSQSVPHSLDTIKPLFEDLVDNTLICIKVGEDSVTYSFGKARNRYTIDPSSEDKARTVWQDLFNEETIEVLSEGDEDSRIFIAEGSYIMIREDRLQFEEGKGGLEINGLNDLEALDKVIRDHIELVTEEGNDTVEFFLEKGTILKVGQSQVKLLKEVKATVDIDPAALEGELEKFRDPEEGSSLIGQTFALVLKVMGEIQGKKTTVTIELGHEMIAHEAVEATCTEEGVEAYWECTVCGKLFADENGDKEIEEPVIIEALGHEIVHHEAVEATCEEDGCKEYWECTKCGLLFADEKLETEVKAEDLVIAAIGHDWEEPTYTWSEDYSEVTATRVCKNNKEHKETETVKTTSDEKKATCEKAGSITYTAKFKNKAFRKQTETVTVEALGHRWGEPEWTWTEAKDGTLSATIKFVCANDEKHVYEEKAEVTSTVDGDTIKYEAVAKGPDGKEYKDTREVVKTGVLRIYGDNRYDTGMKVADYLAELKGVEKFDNVVLTTGRNFPDALSGAYLANQLGAPILLIRDNDKTIKDVQKYIEEHLNESGKIFVLGGVNAVKDEWLGDLAKKYTVTRVRGNNRYLTNIDILNKAGYTGGDILVCTGKDYADSLSGSAVDMPILLVNDALSKEQKEYLGKIKGAKFHIVGGKNAVSEAVEKELGKYGEVVERLAGANRYDTSALLAKKFFPEARKAVLAYGVNFPDGLCGGVIAAQMNAPLIVTISTDRKSFAVDFCSEHSIKSGIVLGGSGLIDDAAVRKIFAMSAKDTIEIYK